jgi:hypothetical protein
MNSPDELRKRAIHYRDMIRDIDDERAIEALRDLAERYDALAAEMEAEEQSRCSPSAP